MNFLKINIINELKSMEFNTLEFSLETNEFPHFSYQELHKIFAQINFDINVFTRLMETLQTYSNSLIKYKFKHISPMKSIFYKTRNTCLFLVVFLEFIYKSSFSTDVRNNLLKNAIQILQSLNHIAFITSPSLKNKVLALYLQGNIKYCPSMFIKIKNGELIKYIIETTIMENTIGSCILNTQLILYCRSNRLSIETNDYEQKLLSCLYLMFKNKSESYWLLNKICSHISFCISIHDLRAFIDVCNNELQTISFVEFLNLIYSSSNVDISEAFDDIQRSLEDISVDSNLEKRQFAYNFTINMINNMQDISLKISQLKKIFNVAAERQSGLNMAQTRILYYNYISKLSVAYPDTVIKEESFNNIFVECFKNIFNKEENEQCIFSLMNIIYSWLSKLDDEQIINLINLIFKASIKLEKSSTYIFSSIMKILASSTDRPNISVNFIKANSKEFMIFADSLFKPPYSSTISEAAILCLVYCFKSDPTIFQSYIKRFYTPNNIKQVLHERNLITFSSSYLDSIIILTISFLEFSIIDEIVFETFTEVIFHCENILFKKYLEILKINISKVSQQTLRIFYEKFANYFVKNCILFNEFSSGNLKVFPTWTKATYHRIYAIINHLLGFMLSKIQDDNTFISQQVILLGFLVNFGKSDKRSFKSFSNLCHLLNINPYIIIMDNKNIALDVLFSQQYVELKINYEATKMFLTFSQDMTPIIMNHVFDIILSSKVMDITEHDLYIYSSSPDTYFDELLQSELTETIELLPKTFKLEHKKMGSIMKADLLKMPIADINSIIKDKQSVELLKFSQKFIKKLEDTYKLETQSRTKIINIKIPCEISFQILKGLIESTGNTLLSHYSPLLCDKLFTSLQNPFLSRSAVDCLLILGEKLFPKGHTLYGRMTILTSLRLSGFKCQLPVELVHTRLEVQVSHTTLNLIHFLTEAIPKKLPLTLSISILSMLNPLIAASASCSESLLNADHFKNVLDLLKLVTTFSSFEMNLSQTLINESIQALFTDIYQFLIYRIETFFEERSLNIQNETCQVFRNMCDQHFALAESILPPSQPNLCVFLTGTISSNPKVRSCSIYALNTMSDYLNILDTENWLLLASRALLLSYEEDTWVQESAKDLVQKFNIIFDEGIMFKLLDDTCHPSSSIREWSSLALFDSFTQDPQYLEFFISRQIVIYSSKLKESEAIKDEEELQNLIQQREGILLSLSTSNQLFGESQVITFINFIMDQCSLDKSNVIQTKLIDICVSVCDNHGSTMADKILVTLEQKSKSISKNKAVYNDLRQLIAIMMGSLSKYLPLDSPILPPVRDQLLVLLNSSKKKVQRMIALNLGHLIHESIPNFNEIVLKLLDQVFNSDATHRVQRGCSFGVCGLCKIIGVTFVEKFNILQRINTFYGDEKGFKRRTCSLTITRTAFEICPYVFEPYSSSLIVHIINCTNTNNTPFLKLSMKTGIVLMKNLSGFGINYVFAPLLKIIENGSKELKSNAISILSSIANCSPKSLPSFLPKVVPVLVSLLMDSSDVISKVADSALRNILNVIKNPEIINIKQSVYSTLRDPVQKTKEFLKCFTNIQFEHMIDIGSLSVIVPIIIRGLDNNNLSNVKIMSLDVIYTLSSLTKSDDLILFSSSIVSKLKDIIYDTTPEVRDHAAFILGSMIKYTDISISLKLVTELEHQLVKTTNSIVQAGAAHGLAEILGGISIEYLEEILIRSCEFLENTKNPPPLRNGYLLLYTHLPRVFGNKLKKYTLQIIGPVIKNLSDISTEVSTTALIVGQSFVSCFGKEALEVIVPYLEEGLLNESWIVRVGSIKLLREVVITMCGFKSKSAISNSVNSAHNENNELSNYLDMLEKLSENMGIDVRNKLIAYVFISRCDLDNTVSDEAFKLWKNLVVGNSTQLLMDISSSILDILLWCFKQKSQFHLKFGVDTLKEITNKTSDRFLRELIVILVKKSCVSGDIKHSIAICIFIREYLTKVSKDTIGDNGLKLVEIIAKSLLSNDSELCIEAANSLSSIEKIFGLEILFPVIDRILTKIRKTNQREKSISAFRFILQHNNIHLLKYILSKVLVKNLDLELIEIISSQSSFTSEQVLNILNSLINDMINNMNNSTYLHEISKVINAFNNNSIKTIINKLLDMNHTMDPSVLTVLTQLLLLCCEKNNDIEFMLDKMHNCCMNLLNCESENVIRIVMQIYQVILYKNSTYSYKRKNLELLIKEFNFNFGKYSALKLTTLPAFCIPDIGIGPFFNIFRHSVMYDFSALLYSSISTLSYFIKLSNYQSLKIIMKPLVGSMIRLLTRHVDWESKFVAFQIIQSILDIKSNHNDRDGDSDNGKAPTSLNEVNLSIFESPLIIVFIRLINDSPPSWQHRKTLCEYMISLRFLPYNLKEYIKCLSGQCNLMNKDIKM